MTYRFFLGDYVKFTGKYTSEEIYGRVFQTMSERQGFYMILPTKGMALYALPEELELVANSNIGIDLFRQCPAECKNGCRYCFYSETMMQVGIRPSDLYEIG